MKIFQVNIERFIDNKKLDSFIQKIVQSDSKPSIGIYRTLKTDPPIVERITEVKEVELNLLESVSQKIKETIKITREKFRNEFGFELEEDRKLFIKWYFKNHEDSFEFILNDIAEFYLKISEVEVLKIIDPDYEPEYKKSKRKKNKIL